MATETATLTPRAAVEEISRLQGLDAALARRASGISWMIWGLAVAGMFMTYNFLGVLMELGEGGVSSWFGFVWIPWVAMGVAATMAVWRSAGLVAPGLGDTRQGLRSGIVFLVLFLVVMPIVMAVSLPMTEPAIMLGVLGLASLTVGITGLGCRERGERVLWVVGGLLILAVTLAGSLVVGDDRQAGYEVFSILGPVSTAVVYFGNGLWQTLRG